MHHRIISVASEMQHHKRCEKRKKRSYRHLSLRLFLWRAQILGLRVVGLARGVFEHIRALVLEGVAEAEELRLAQREENEAAQDAHPQEDHDNTHKLSAKLITTVQNSVPAEAFLRVAEEAQRQGAPDSATAVHRERINHIIDLQPLQQHGRGQIDEAANEAYNDRLPGLHSGTA